MLQQNVRDLGDEHFESFTPTERDEFRADLLEEIRKDYGLRVDPTPVEAKRSAKEGASTWNTVLSIRRDLSLDDCLRNLRPANDS